MEGTEILLKGLQNKGENNCFINVVVQILWNIPETRNQLLSQTHVHENPTPCITCEISVISTQNLFVNMKYSALKTFSTQHLREVLSTVATLQTDFLLNNMGCAIETFEEILDILHQESLPNCSESCITHKYFSIQFCEEVSCCESFEIQEIQNIFMLRVYAKELEFEFRKAKTIGTRFQDFLGNALRNSDLQKKKTCKVCNEKISTIKRWISTPKILAISIVWDPSDYDFARILMMTFRMELQSRSIFFAEDEQEITEVYIFRGIVCFQYNHYCTFIFVPEENSWYQVDDSFIKKIQNFTQIIQMMEKNNSIPVLLLYENDYGQMKRKNQRIGKIKENENDRNCLSCEIF